jgi:hypothetical protein
LTRCVPWALLLIPRRPHCRPRYTGKIETFYLPRFLFTMPFSSSASSNCLVVLFFLLSCLPSAYCLHLKIVFTHQSQLNDVNQWFTMFTLCLAPLVSHLALGLPRTVLMSPESADDELTTTSESLFPPWTERITLFNPISLVWRYYSIVYFRLRSPSWDAADLAAANPAFWNTKTRRWDGTDRTLFLSRRYLTSPPESSHVKVLSGSTLATIVLTMQGVQGGYFLVGGTVSKYIGFPDGLPTTFLPIGLLGLLRLPAAAWLSNEWGYTFPKKRKHDGSDDKQLRDRNELGYERGELGIKYTGLATSEAMGEDPDESQLPLIAERRLLDTRSWKCRAYRAWWILSICGLMILAITDIAISFNPYHRNQPLSISDLLYSILYLELCTGFLLITPTFVLQRDHASTIIPCVQSLWYKLYTGLIMLTALAAVVVASLETVQLPDGTFTTEPPLLCYGDSCVSWNKTILMENMSGEWDRYLNLTAGG